jgi:hypothetical protein
MTQARHDRAPAWPDASAVNEAIRQYVSAHGRRPWSAKERTELDRLRAAWLAAVRGKPHATARP